MIPPYGRLSPAADARSTRAWTHAGISSAFVIAPTSVATVTLNVDWIRWANS